MSRTGDIDELRRGDRGGNGRRMVRRRDPIHGSTHDECRCAAEGSVSCCAVEVRDRAEETRQDWQVRRVDEGSQGGRLLRDESPYWFRGADCGGADRFGGGGDAAGQRTGTAGERSSQQSGKPIPGDVRSRSRDEPNSHDSVRVTGLVMLQVLQDGHGPHGMADEHDVAVGCRRVDDGVEVTGELPDCATEGAPATGATVSALVVGDYADVRVARCQMTCLAPPTAPVAQESVQENHRQIRNFGTNLSRRQGKPVGCDDGNPLCCYWVHQRGQQLIVEMPLVVPALKPQLQVVHADRKRRQ